MQGLYLVPINVIINGENASRGPAYFAWRLNPNGIVCTWAMMDYGFMPTGLVVTRDISESDDAALRANSDVYSFPLANLGNAIPGSDNLKSFCENVNIPADWTTSSTTYLELLRMLAGTFQFAQRYGLISGGQSLISGGATLATRYRNLTVEQQAWFNAAVESFGYSASIINQNNTLRQMLKLVGDAWGTKPFYLGGMEF